MAVVVEQNDGVLRTAILFTSWWDSKSYKSCELYKHDFYLFVFVKIPRELTWIDTNYDSCIKICKYKWWKKCLCWDLTTYKSKCNLTCQACYGWSKDIRHVCRPLGASVCHRFTLAVHYTNAKTTHSRGSCHGLFRNAKRDDRGFILARMARYIRKTLWYITGGTHEKHYYNWQGKLFTMDRVVRVWLGATRLVHIWHGSIISRRKWTCQCAQIQIKWRRQFPSSTHRCGHNPLALLSELMRHWCYNP